MTEHGASIFVFFFLGEYSSLILMSAFMSIFFLGGHHCPDLHKLILDPLSFIYTIFDKYSTKPLADLSDYILYKWLNFYHPLYLDNSDLYDLNSVSYFSNKNIIWDYLAKPLSYLNEYKDSSYYIKFNDQLVEFNSKDTLFSSLNLLLDKIQGSYILGFKIIMVVFFYIWVRASFPRFRYDQLMALCWKELLPLVFAYILFTICLFYTFDMMPFGNTF